MMSSTITTFLPFSSSRLQPLTSTGTFALREEGKEGAPTTSTYRIYDVFNNHHIVVFQLVEVASTHVHRSSALHA